MKKRKQLLAILALSAAFSWSLPAFAKEFTTSDSVLTIDTPDDSWAQIKDDATLATLTNGKDSITLEHYSNGEKLPDITVADDTYEVTDLWSGEKEGTQDQALTADIPAHGVKLVRLDRVE